MNKIHIVQDLHISDYTDKIVTRKRTPEEQALVETMVKDLVSKMRSYKINIKHSTYKGY